MQKILFLTSLIFITHQQGIVSLSEFNDFGNLLQSKHDEIEQLRSNDPDWQNNFTEARPIKLLFVPFGQNNSTSITQIQTLMIPKLKTRIENTFVLNSPEQLSALSGDQVCSGLAQQEGELSGDDLDNDFVVYYQSRDIQNYEGFNQVGFCDVAQFSTRTTYIQIDFNSNKFSNAQDL